MDTRSATGLGLDLGMYGGGEGAASGLAARVCLKTAELECQAEGGGGAGPIAGCGGVFRSGCCVGFGRVGAGGGRE